MCVVNDDEAREVFGDLTGYLRFEHAAGRTCVLDVYSKYPLKFIQPRGLSIKNKDAVVIYIVGYGGGFVSGDAVTFRCEVGKDCTAALFTQASTKIYKRKGCSEDQACSMQRVYITLAPGSLLAYLPDPVVCFRSSAFTQRQEIHLSRGASLILVDWMTSGRKRFHQRGSPEKEECWEFELYDSTIQISVNLDRLLLDRVRLESTKISTLKSRMRSIHVLATVISIGPSLSSVTASMLSVCSRNRQFDPTSNSRLILEAACPLGDDGAILRIAARDTECVYDRLRTFLGPLEARLGSKVYPRSK